MQLAYSKLLNLVKVLNFFLEFYCTRRRREVSAFLRPLTTHWRSKKKKSMEEMMYSFSQLLV